MAESGRLLADDHLAIDGLLKELKTALESGDVETSQAKLDLFWARLAVHIRAEHLHLFPMVMSALRETTRDDSSELVLMGAEDAIGELRNDHNFFIRDLAEAIQTIRTLRKFSDQRIDRKGLNKIQSSVLEIEGRLIRHNLLEEHKVYRWAGMVLSEQKQIELAREIERELTNRPPRFSAEEWHGAVARP
jgi:hemerythrin superfamily protein